MMLTVHRRDLCLVIFLTMTSYMSSIAAQSCWDNNICHSLAECVEKDDGSFSHCTCIRGTLGDGYKCSEQGWTVRMTFTVSQTTDSVKKWIDAAMDAFAAALISDHSHFVTDESRLLANSAWIEEFYPEEMSEKFAIGPSTIVILSPLFATQREAVSALNLIATGSRFLDFVQNLSREVANDVVHVLDPPQRVYPWQSGLSVSEDGVMISVESAFLHQQCVTDSAGCWTLDITYTSSVIGYSRPMNVLYLPRSDGGRTTAQIRQTFDSDNHPCREQGLEWSSVCCCHAFASEYRTLDTFETFVQSFAADCKDDSAPDSSFLEGQEDAVFGIFSDMVHSRDISRGMVDNTGNRLSARLELPLVDIEKAGIVTVQDESVGSRRIEMYVGIAHITPTFSSFIDSTVEQFGFALEESPSMSAFIRGGDGSVKPYKFEASLNELLSSSEQDPGGMQYITLIFKLKNVEGGMQDPIPSLRVRKGLFLSPPAWESVCSGFPRNQEQDNINRWFGQDCAPSAKPEFCRAMYHDGSVTMNVPLNMNYFFLHNGVGIDGSIVIEFELDTIAPGSEGDGTILEPVQVTAQIPVLAAVVTTYCAAELHHSLRDIAIVHMIPSVPDDALNLESKVEELEVWNTSEREMKIYTIDGGSDGERDTVITLVVQGSAPHPQDQDEEEELDSVVLVDLITAHVLESGQGGIMEEISDLIASGEAFEITQMPSPGSLSMLNPSPALERICTIDPQPSTRTDPFPHTCVLRRELGKAGTALSARDADASALSIFVGSLPNSGGGEGVERVGEYVALLEGIYSLNEQKSSAWLFGAGYPWASGSQAFASPHVMAFALLGLNSTLTARRKISCVATWNGIKCLELVTDESLASGALEAEHVCQSRGGELGWISNQQEHEKVVDMLRSWNSTQSIWIRHDALAVEGQVEVEGHRVSGQAIAVNQRFVSNLGVSKKEPAEGNSDDIATDLECSFMAMRTAEWIGQPHNCSANRAYVCSYITTTPSVGAITGPCISMGTVYAGKRCFVLYPHALVTAEEASARCAESHIQGQLAIFDNSYSVSLFLSLQKEEKDSAGWSYWAASPIFLGTETLPAHIGWYHSYGDQFDIRWKSDGVFDDNAESAPQLEQCTALGPPLSEGLRSIEVACTRHRQFLCTYARNPLDDPPAGMGAVGMVAAGLEYSSVHSSRLVAQVLAVEEGRTTSWRVRTALTRAEACSARKYLGDAMRGRMMDAATAAGGVTDVYVVSVRVLGNNNCSAAARRLRRLQQLDAPEGVFEAIIITSQTNGKVDLSALRQQSSVIAVQELEKPSSGDVQPDQSALGLKPISDSKLASPDLDDGEGSKASNNNILIAALSATGAMLFVCLGCAAWWYSAKSGKLKADEVESPNVPPVFSPATSGPVFSATLQVEVDAVNMEALGAVSNRRGSTVSADQLAAVQAMGAKRNSVFTNSNDNSPMCASSALGAVSNRRGSTVSADQLAAVKAMGAKRNSVFTNNTTSSPRPSESDFFAIAGMGAHRTSGASAKQLMSPALLSNMLEEDIQAQIADADGPQIGEADLNMIKAMGAKRRSVF